MDRRGPQASHWDSDSCLSALMMVGGDAKNFFRMTLAQPLLPGWWRLSSGNNSHVAKGSSLASGAEELQDSSARFPSWKESLIVSPSPSHASSGISAKGQQAGEGRTTKEHVQLDSQESRGDS